MKRIIFTATTVLLSSQLLFAQGSFTTSLTSIEPASKQESVPKPKLSFEIKGSYERPVIKETLENAITISDFIDGYPSNWIDQYVSVTITAINNGKEMRAISTNDKLTAEQKNILKSVDLNSDIDISIKYEVANPVTSISVDKITDYSTKVINIRMTVIPETEAQYITGSVAMKTYIQENIINKISETAVSKIKSARVLFTINAQGEIDQVILLNPTGDSATDQLMIHAITNMPKWKPAETDNGVKVKQYFQFTMGVYGC